MKKFEGVMPALITPLTAEEKLNVPALHQLLSMLLDQGAYGFYIGGATGEGIALSREVREELAAECVKFVNHRQPCIVHIASANFHEAVALAKQAESCGADAISAIPPMFYSYDENEVYQYYKKLAESVHIPLMIYFNPAAGFNINAEFAARAFEIDNITAIKWTSSNYFGMMRLKDLTRGEMNIINGPDEMLLMGLNAGADGGIGSTYNIMMPRIKSIYENFRSGNITAAHEAQMAADRVIDALLKHKVIPGCKIALEKMGIPVGECVFPMKRYTAEEKEELLSALRASGLEI